MDLLCEEETNQTTQADYIFDEKHIIDVFRNSDIETKRRLIRYFELIEVCREINHENESKNIKRNVSVIQDIDGNNIVMINDIVFKGKRSVEWKDVRSYLKEYVGEFYTIAATGDVIYIGSDLPNEYSGSYNIHHSWCFGGFDLYTA